MNCVSMSLLLLPAPFWRRQASAEVLRQPFDPPFPKIRHKSRILSLPNSSFRMRCGTPGTGKGSIFQKRRGKGKPMKKLMIAMRVIFALGFIATASYAGWMDSQSGYSPWAGEYKSAKSGEKSLEYRASTIIGSRVQNREGDYLGRRFIERSV